MNVPQSYSAYSSRLSGHLAGVSWPWHPLEETSSVHGTPLMPGVLGDKNMLGGFLQWMGHVFLLRRAKGENYLLALKTELDLREHIIKEYH